MQTATALETSRAPTLSGIRLNILVILRILIGWHFLYEGIAKLASPYWTAAGYLSESRWIFSGLFRGMARSPFLMSIIDVLNSWGLAIIGLCLILGLFSRYASIAGVVLLFLYWLAAPPLAGYRFSAPMEGNYLLVNKTLIEMFALWVVVLFPTSKQIGLDRLLPFGKQGA
jgi:thiosulfate dehydrogenase [quinone] large subunit